MKKLFLIFVVLFSVTIIPGLVYLRYVNPTSTPFQDSNLESAIREELGKAEGPLSRNDLRLITSLNARGYGIRSLEGIQQLEALRSLDLEDNFIVDVTPLAGLKDLEHLSLRNNEIIDLSAIHFSALQELSNLKSLSLRHNVLRPDPDNRSYQYRLADISILEHFPSLEVLELRDNYIREIDVLGNLENLRVLDISQNPIHQGDIGILSKLSRLAELNLRECDVSDLTPLKQLTELTYLNIHSNSRIASLAPLQGLTTLETLIMRDVPIGDDIRYLSGMTRLNRLNIRNSGISDVTVLATLMDAGALMDSLDIRENPVLTTDGIASLYPYWDNIIERYPRNLNAE